MNNSCVVCPPTSGVLASFSSFSQALYWDTQKFFQSVMCLTALPRNGELGCVLPASTCAFTPHDLHTTHDCTTCPLRTQKSALTLCFASFRRLAKLSAFFVALQGMGAILLGKTALHEIRMGVTRLQPALTGPHHHNLSTLTHSSKICPSFTHHNNLH